MPDLPVITTERLHLRPFSLDDAEEVQGYVADRAIASTTLLIPHPYPDGGAAHWIRRQSEGRTEGWAFDLAITDKQERCLVGAISLNIEREHHRAELGYWIGRPFWNRGYATEAAEAVIKHGFEHLDLQRIFAHHMTRNPASGRVLQKAGMQFEGVLRQHVRKWDAYEDVAMYAILRGEYEKRKRESSKPQGKSARSDKVTR